MFTSYSQLTKVLDMASKVCLCVAIFYIIRCQGVELVKVRVEQGVLEGQVLVPSTSRGKYYSFKGIPYARPPLGKLRFRAPVAPQLWTGVRNASEHGPICIQHESPTSNIITGNEDCLYLNVYSPNLNPRTPLPVMFFIHGGYLISGSGNSDLYGPDFLVGYNVILVTINYRLDAIGFLSVDTEAVPGNAGLKDQIAALKWVKRNIKHFGGDPENVTIFGQSAGSVSVTLHLLSPAAKGLFNRAIGMSGAVFNDWAITFEHKKRAFALGRNLGINTTDTSKLIEFLQEVPAEKLVEIRPNILISDAISHSFLTTFYFTPIVEKKFNNRQYLTENPRDLLLERRVNEVDFMAGQTQSEGLSFTTILIDNILKNYEKYEELYVPVKISNIRSPNTVFKLSNRIKNHYITNTTILSSIKGFVDYYTYSHFAYEIHNFFDRYSKVSCRKQYFYSFSIYSSRNFYSKEADEKFGIRLSTHRDDLPYLFDGTTYNMTVNVKSEVFKYIDLMCKLFTNFARYGNPTPANSHGFFWPSYDQGMSYLDIADKPTVGHLPTYYTGDLGFWQSIYSDAGVVPYMN